MSELRYGQPYERIHVAGRPGVRALCGALITARDEFTADGGPRAWASRPEDRCLTCERLLRARAPERDVEVLA